MKKILLLFVFAAALTNVMAQSAGDYRSTVNATTLSSKTGWETFDGTSSSWVAATYAPAGNTLTVVQSGTTINASASVTLDAANSLVSAGQYVTGTGIATGTTVFTISGTSLTLSQPATADGTAITLSFAESFAVAGTGSSGSTAVTLGASNAAIVAGMAVSGTGIVAGTKVSGISGTTLTLSTASSGAVSGNLTFYTLSTSASFATASTTITLGAANPLVSVGMSVYGASGLVAGTKVTSVSGTTIGISMPTTTAITNKIGLVFGYLNIPNLNINNVVSTSTNSRASTIKNVVINSGGNLTIGSASTSGNDLVCNTMTVNSGGSLSTTNFTGTAQTNTLEINGGENATCFTNNGTVDLTTTTGGNSVTNIVFTVPGNTIMSGSGTTNFNKITMNMCGVLANTLDVQSVFSMLAATTAPTLTLTSGTLKISGASTITPFGGNCTSSANAVPALAGLFLNNASAIINWGTAVADGTGMQVRGALTLAAGTLYVKGRYDANGAGVTTISGGTLEIPSGITISSSTAALFHMGGIHSLFMSGGNINLKIHNAGGYGNPDYYNVATVQSLTGGTITFSDAAAMNSNTSKFYNLTVQNGGGAGTTLTRNSTITTILNNLTVGAGSTLDNGTQNFLPSFAINGNTTINSALVPLQSSGCVAVGQFLAGTGIPANTTVTGITQTQTTGIVTSGSNQVTGVPTNSGYAVNNMIFGSGIAANTTVTGIAGTGPYTLTISPAATASSTTAEVLIINPVITMSNPATAANSNSQVVFYNATAFTNTGSGTIKIQSTSNPAYPANTSWASTMNLNGSAGSQNLLTGTYTDVVINNTFSTPVVNMQNGGTNLLTGVAYNGASTINGTLTLTNGALTLNGKMLTLAGSVPTRTSGIINPASGALVFSNSTPISLPTGIFASNTIGSSLAVNGTGAVTLPADAIAVNGATTVGTGATLGLSAALTTGSSAPATITGTLALNAGSLILNAGLTINGSISSTSGTIDASAAGVTVSFDNATGFTLPANLFSANVNKLTLNGAGGITLGSPLTVDNLLTLTKGIISLGTNDLTIGATGSISGGSATSYIATDISGKLNLPVLAATPTLLPIGVSTSSYDPATVTATNATTFSAKVSSTLSGSPISGIFYNPREWSLVPLSASATTISLTPSTNAVLGQNAVIGQWDGGSGYTNYVFPYASSTYNTGASFGTIAPFVFVTGKTDTATALHGAATSNINAYSKNSTLMINGLNTGDVISVYNLNGQSVKSFVANEGQSSIALAKGGYVVKVISAGDTKISKVIVQ